MALGWWSAPDVRSCWWTAVDGCGSWWALVVQHSATVLQPLGSLYQPATQQYAAAAQHLPVPVPAELQQQIIRGEFVDFAVLTMVITSPHPFSILAH